MPVQGFGAGSSGGSTGTRFSVELPLASDSPAELAGLAADLLAALPAAATAGACIVAASEQVAAAVQAARSSSGRQGSGPVLSLRAACQADSLSGPLLLLAPATSDVSGAAAALLASPGGVSCSVISQAAAASACSASCGHAELASSSIYRDTAAATAATSAAIADLFCVTCAFSKRTAAASLLHQLRLLGSSNRAHIVLPPASPTLCALPVAKRPLAVQPPPRTSAV